MKDFTEHNISNGKVNQSVVIRLGGEKGVKIYIVPTPLICELSDPRPHYQINQPHRPGRNFISFVAYLLQGMVPKGSL